MTFMETNIDMYLELEALGDGASVVGIDEVGRGSVAGPLTVAAVMLPLEPRIAGLDDSKKLSAKKRETLAATIREVAGAIGIAHISPQQIDKDGMARCLRIAMLEALAATGIEPDVLFIDGNPMHIHPAERCVVKGDGRIACIAAASIVAKVTRDALMTEASERYPGYGLASNKGYASAAHIKAIREMGLTEIHRRSFCGGFFQESLF
jgi:ribonuclease HII